MQTVKLKAMPPMVKNAKFELKEEEDLVPFSGVAAEYNVEIERWFGIMMLAPGCFEDSIGDPGKIVMLAHHYGDTPIGKADAFRDSDERLEMDFKINPNIQAGKEMVSNLNHSIIAGLSVGFDTVTSEFVKVGEGQRAYEVERITKARLMEVSVVVWPAIDGARVNQASEAEAGRVRPIPQLTEDQMHPGARDALMHILAR